ncbi:hypothetical protein VE00_09302 [Pseudogymnoascus sp. WSF 3629]|nr:hypothetical protein VE00_09302 [Pseudogymnoascus sp. WSF 3629]
MALIFESELEPELEALINPQLRSGSEPELSIELRIRSSQLEPDLNSKLGIESSYSEPELGIELEPELSSELWRPAPTRAQARAQAQLRAVPGLGIELKHSRLNSKPRAQAQAQPQVAPELGIKPEL